MLYHGLPGRWLDSMRPEGCAIQYAAGGLDVLLDRRRPVAARATAVWAACSSKPGGTAGLWHRCRTGRDSALSGVVNLSQECIRPLSLLVRASLLRLLVAVASLSACLNCSMVPGTFEAPALPLPCSVMMSTGKDTVLGYRFDPGTIEPDLFFFFFFFG